MWLVLRIKTVLRSMILPPAGPLLLAVVGLLLMKRRPRLARVCLVAAVSLLWLLSTPVVSDALEALAESYPPLDLRSAAGAQAIVILGGGGERAFAPEYAGMAAEPIMLERLSYGAYVARRTNLPILVTGYSIETSGHARDAVAQFRDRTALGGRQGLRHFRECAQFRPVARRRGSQAHRPGDPRHPHAARGP